MPPQNLILLSKEKKVPSLEYIVVSKTHKHVVSDSRINSDSMIIESYGSPKSKVIPNYMVIVDGQKNFERIHSIIQTLHSELELEKEVNGYTFSLEPTDEHISNLCIQFYTIKEKKPE